MNANDDRELSEWAADWQAAEPDLESSEQIRHYVKRHGRLVRSWMVTDFVIGIIALPILAYLGWVTESDIERTAMIALASITVAAVGFGWWNWRSVLRSSATSVSDYVAISGERLRRMRLAWRLGWIILAAQVIVFIIWIWDHLYSGARPPSPDAERFAWTWLGGMTLAAIGGLLWFGRWIRRDTERFEALRKEFD
jgi:hypothetical protein